MLRSFFDWLDDRTGLRHTAHEALYENVPSGARFRYVTGSMLVFAFLTQAITGLFLWMAYSPSSQTAYESVWYIQHQMAGGWLLRGIHHFMAQAMVVVMALHLLQVVWDGAYRKPREVNYWLGLVLMMLVLGLGLTGYLLPWDQKGFWATNVATNLMTLVPVVGKDTQVIAVGGGEYGHHTLTRFFALHAGWLPALFVVILAGHLALFRRHGLTAKITVGRPDDTFWPKQVLFDAIGCLVLLGIVLALVLQFRGAELGAPADPAEQYSAARPEWYYLFLFQLLKYFPGSSEIIGAIVIPGVVVAVLFLLPFLGLSRFGHQLSRAFVVLLLLAAGGLTLLALADDYFVPLAQRLKWTPDDEGSPRHPEWLFADKKAFQKRLDASQDFLKAREEAERDAHRIHELINRREMLPDGTLSDVRLIPRQGAVSLLRNDPLSRGPRLFAQHCASCHDYVDPDGESPWRFAYQLQRPKVGSDGKVERDGEGKVVYEDAANGAPNLFGFGTPEWIKGLLNKELIAKIEYGEPIPSTDPEIAGDENHPGNHLRPIIAPYFGNTNHKEGRMATWVAQHEELLADDPAKGDDNVDAIAAALSAQARLPAQQEPDKLDKDLIRRGLGLIEQNCTKGCHKLGEHGQLGLAPDLTGYGSYEWMLGLVSDPMHDRFYGQENDRMPSFAFNLDQPERNNLSVRELSLIVDWLRGQYYVADSERPVLAHSAAQAEQTVRLARATADGSAVVVGAPKPEEETELARAERLFARNCAACHNHTDEHGSGIAAKDPSAPNLFGFGSRAWLAGFLDPEQVATPKYFGNTRHAEGDMVTFVNDSFGDLDDDAKETLQALIVAISAEAALPAQGEADQQAEQDGTLEKGRAAIAESFDGGSCIDCHKFRDEGDLGSAPDLTGWGSKDWLTRFLSDPAHEDFYRDTNDRMPAFGQAGPGPTIQPLLAPDEIDLLTRFLRNELE